MFPNRKRETFTPALLRLLGRWPAWPVGFVRPQNTALSRIKLQNYSNTELYNYINTEIQNYPTQIYSGIKLPSDDLKET